MKLVRNWPEGSALYSVELFTRGIPSDKQQPYFEERFPDHEFAGYFDNQQRVNQMITRYTDKHPLSQDAEEALKAGRKVSKLIPGGSVDRTQGHSNTKALHAFISSTSTELKYKGGVSDKKRRTTISEDWQGNKYGSGKSQALKDRANELHTERNARKAEERKVEIRKKKEEAAEAEI